MDLTEPTNPMDQQQLANLTAEINRTIENWPDKEWSYSRIILQMRPLHSIEGACALWIEQVPVNTKKGQNDLKALMAEVAWGERHSNELGILEIISLRLNKALLEASTDDSWGFLRPVIRIVGKEVLIQQGVPSALWYEVHEVSGEEFDNR